MPLATFPALSSVHCARLSGAPGNQPVSVAKVADSTSGISINSGWRAVAVAMRDGPEAGLTLIDALLARGDLENYHLAHSARADLCRRLGRTAEARSAYERALTLTRLEPERRFLEKRLRELGVGSGVK